MSVGGVASAGGWTANYKDPFVVGAIPGIHVVTPDGTPQKCSSTTNSKLFRRVLGGVGQHGIITSARIDLVPVLPMARTWILPYTGIETAVRDMVELAGRGELDELHVAWKAPDPTTYYLEGAIYFDPDEGVPDDARLLRGLASAPSAVQDRDYLAHVFEFADPLYDAAEEQGWNDLLKPWGDWAVSEHRLSEFVPAAVEAMRPDLYSATSVGLVLFKSGAALDGRPTPPLPEIPAGRGVGLVDFLMDHDSREKAAESAAVLDRVDQLDLCGTSCRF